VKVIVGLGNPGEEYKNTRHNAGFMVTGELASRHNIDGRFNNKFNSIIGKGIIENIEVLIVQPMTFMNLSGNAVAKILNWYNIEPDELLVIFDDVNLNLGKIRFRPSGSDGGHNGIKSIIENLGGYDNFPRLKVGIGPKPEYMSLEAFVLQEFSKSEREILGKVIPVCAEGIEEYLKEGMTETRSRFNGINLAPEAEE
jgi:PTH1 family peptidyl-tRNA hydrolase